ncbi:MAG: hypothetical protein JW940_15455 [Polyangiaceae bacterium]|nr:hypothetical protein [Polyangiaceae bacterium]
MTNPTTNTAASAPSNPVTAEQPDQIAGAPSAATQPDTTNTPAPRWFQIFELMLPEIEAVADSDLAPINVDIPTAVTTVLGNLPEIAAVRPLIVRDLPTFDISKLDQLQNYTLALSHAHTLYRAAWAPKVDVATLAAELAALRDQLMLDASSLASYCLINAQRLKECKSAQGYRPVAYDVLTVVTVLRESWTSIAGRTPLTLDVLDHAAALAEQFLQAVGLRDQSPPTVGEASVIRHKAFTLFFNVYEDIRRAVQYVRGKNGDADEIAPSLYSGRATARRKATEEPAAATTPAAPTQADTAAALPTPVAVASAGLPITQPFQG